MSQDELVGADRRAQDMLDATETGDIQEIASVLCSLDEQDDLSMEDRATARLAHAYTQEEGYDGLEAYARDILAADADSGEDRPSLKRAAFDTVLGTGIAAYWSGEAGALAAGESASLFGVAAGAGGVYIAAGGLNKGYKALTAEEARPELPSLDIGPTDILDGPAEEIREELYREHGVDTYEP